MSLYGTLQSRDPVDDNALAGFGDAWLSNLKTVPRTRNGADVEGEASCARGVETLLRGRPPKRGRLSGASTCCFGGRGASGMGGFDE